MSGRQIFSEAEKLCLQELIIKYKLNTASNPAEKKVAWARIVEEYNSIESNIKRTESQLKKCWDNLKTRKKALLYQEKNKRIRTGDGPFPSRAESLKEDPLLLDEAVAGQTETELKYDIDSDNSPENSRQGCAKVNKLIRRNNYKRAQDAHDRAEQMHSLVVAEKQWLVKAAREAYKKAVIERKTAEEILRLNQVKREEAELLLLAKKNNM